jgi:hypothetical protein
MRFIGPFRRESPTGRFLDAGCGTGGLSTSERVARLGQPIWNRHFPAGRGLSPGTRTTAHIAVSSVNALPFPPTVGFRLPLPFRSHGDLSAGRHPFARDLRVLSLYRAGGPSPSCRYPHTLWLWGLPRMCQVPKPRSGLRHSRPEKPALRATGSVPCFRELLEHGAAPAACLSGASCLPKENDRNAMLKRMYSRAPWTDCCGGAPWSFERRC